MKRVLSFALVITVCLVLTSCLTPARLTERVTEWLLYPTTSEITYEMGGISGNAVFEYRSEKDNSILFTSGEGLEGVKFTFSGESVIASREADGISWEITPEMAQTLSAFGKIYSYAATLTYTPVSAVETGNESIAVNIFEYTDGKCEIHFNKEDGRILFVSYTQGEETVNITINKMERIIPEQNETE